MHPSDARQVSTFASPLVGNYGVDEALLESGRVWTEGVVMRRARPEWADWARAARRRRAGRGRRARRSPPPRGRSHALRAWHGAGGGAARPRARPPPPRLAAHARRSPACLTPTRARRVRDGAVLGRRRPAGRRARPRLQALDRAARRDGRRGGRRSRTWDAEARASVGPAVVLIGNGPGDPAQLDGPVETVRELLGRSRSSGSASATSSSGLRSAWATFKLPFGHRGANHPVRVTGSKRVLVTAQNDGFAVAPGYSAEVSHVLLERRHRRGPPRRRLRDAPVPPRGRARPARRRSLLRTGSRTRAEAHRPTQHPDRRLRADPHRPGLRVRLRRRPGLPRCAPRATTSCWRTRTRRRS